MGVEYKDSRLKAGVISHLIFFKGHTLTPLTICLLTYFGRRARMLFDFNSWTCEVNTVVAGRCGWMLAHRSSSPPPSPWAR